MQPTSRAPVWGDDDDHAFQRPLLIRAMLKRPCNRGLPQRGRLMPGLLTLLLASGAGCAEESSVGASSRPGDAAIGEAGSRALGWSDAPVTFLGRFDLGLSRQIDAEAPSVSRWQLDDGRTVQELTWVGRAPADSQLWVDLDCLENAFRWSGHAATRNTPTRVLSIELVVGSSSTLTLEVVNTPEGRVGDTAYWQSSEARERTTWAISKEPGRDDMAFVTEGLPGPETGSLQVAFRGRIGHGVYERLEVSVVGGGVLCALRDEVSGDVRVYAGSGM